MSDNNKSYRIKANVGAREETVLNVKLDQDYDSFQILSLTLKGTDTYRLHNANYGVIVGRVLANENFGVPNAKVSVFIAADTENMSLADLEMYPYLQTSTTNSKGVRYNLLPNEKIADCHQPVGTFPTKSYLLDNDDLIEIFDKYYVYTTRTNNAGDYMICGVPVGNHDLHMDLDLSDCGILSQRPRDFVYKGYTIEQFENPNMFKTGTTISSLSQIFSQNQTVNVVPFWGDIESGEEIGITRADIHISFTFEPTCVFLGSVVSDNASNGISQKCVPTNNMGAMDELTTGKGTIEIIRKTPGGNIEQFSVKGDQVIDGNGVWCYQIPMNLDYMMTDEYGNMVPTDDPSKGIPTRTRVRFRLSLEDFGQNSDNYFRSKALIPNNPDISAHGNIDYNFGSETQDSSFRDLYWNNVYTVKSYIPRFQKAKRWRSSRFSGIKHCNIYGNNNPIPYNNIRIRLPLVFMILCAILTNFIKLTFFINKFIYKLTRKIVSMQIIGKKHAEDIAGAARYILFGERLCEDLEGWYFAPGANTKVDEDGYDLQVVGTDNDRFLLQQTYDILYDKQELEHITDNTSIDTQNQDEEEANSVCITTDVDYLLSCLEMQLAQEYKVIQFDFYNDWINGMVYLPRWKRIVKTKRHFWMFTWKRKKIKIKGCMNAGGTGTAKSRYFVQQCALEYKGKNNEPFTEVVSTLGCGDNGVTKVIKNTDRYNKTGITNMVFKPQVCHKARGLKRVPIFGKKNGVVTEVKTSRNQYVYYLKPCEWGGVNNNGTRVLLYATDLVLLGSLNDCDDNGIPQAFKHLESSSYKMPTNIALTTMDDDTFIYTDTGATICRRSTKETLQPEQYNDGVKRQSTTYASTNKAYSVNRPSDQISYENNDEPIAVTEAAGICWNYTGPGQDVLKIGDTQMNLNPADDIMDDLTKQKYLYYPGGHFLGLSCLNSRTNIKSCINLQRICEVGTTMSERHEIVRGYNEEKQELKYRYLVPTGFIAQDELNDVPFRTMFATMNHKKLIADKLDEKTGYPIYGFEFKRPNGFDGAFTKYAYQDNTPYNHNVQSPNFVDEKDVMQRLFELNGWSVPEDYDDEESANTETRTIEDPSVDYYMFRMGLNSLKVNDQMERFLITHGTANVSMPQYENSFYFYFGLKDGATALDEFKRQFFSECEKRTVVAESRLRTKADIHYCDLNATFTVMIDGMIPTYRITIINNKNGKPVTIDGVYMEDVEQNADIITYTLPVGVYTVTVEDAEERSKSITLDLAGSVGDIGNYRTVHYRTSGGTVSDVTDKQGRLGGYLLFDTLQIINGEYYYISSDSERRMTIPPENEEAKPIVLFADDGNNMVQLDTIEYYPDAYNDRPMFENKTRVFGLLPNVSYDIYAAINCGNGLSTDKFFIDTVTLKTNENIDLYYGCYELSYKNILSKLNGDWWDNFTTESLNNINTEADKEILAWVMKTHMFRQETNDSFGFNSHVFGYSSEGEKINTITFGEPERKNRGYEVKHSGYAETYYDQFNGYVLSDENCFYPTWGIDNAPDQVYKDYSNGRTEFSKMVYTDDGRTAADPLDVFVTTATTNGDEVTLTFSGNLTAGTGVIVVFENGEIVFPFMTSNNTGIYYGDEPADTTSQWLAMAAVYPTFRYPVMYRPFFSTVKFLTMASVMVKLPEITESGKEPFLDYSLKEIFTGGELHNGITFKDSLSTNLADTEILGFTLEGTYPADPLTPEIEGEEYKSFPLSGEGWTRQDASSEFKTYQSGRTIDIKPNGSIMVRDVHQNPYPGFPYNNYSNTGDSISFTFTQGYPSGITLSSNTIYSALTQPYFPEIAECSDSFDAVFVNYIAFENNGTSSTAPRILYGDIDNTEYEDETGFLRYYDITTLSMSDLYMRRCKADSGKSTSETAWVYTNDETAKKRKPSAYVACFASGDTFVDAGGSNIQYVKVYEKKGLGNKVKLEIPQVVDGKITKTPKDMGGGWGTIEDDIIKCLAQNKDGKGADELYRILTEDCGLTPLKKPSPYNVLEVCGNTFGISFKELIDRAYDTFLRAEPSKRIRLSKNKRFDGGVPSEVLGVCKHINGRNETYVLKYYNCVYNFGGGTLTDSTTGEESKNTVSTDIDTVPITGATFNVTIDSDVEWILVVSSTTNQGVTIKCNPTSITQSMIESCWVAEGSDAAPSKYCYEGIRNIQKVDEDTWRAANWDDAGGYHYPPGKYVFTVHLAENRTGKDLNLSIMSIPYYPQDDIYPEDQEKKYSQIDIIQPTRKVIEIYGTITTRNNSYSYNRARVGINYSFELLNGENWPPEVTFTCSVTCHMYVEKTTSYSDSFTVNVDVDVNVNVDGDSGATYSGGGSGSGSGGGSVGGNAKTGTESDTPFTFTVSKEKRSGYIDIFDSWEQNSNGYTEIVNVNYAYCKFINATFNNLGDNYTGKATLNVDGSQYTIIQPDEGNN